MLDRNWLRSLASLDGATKNILSSYEFDKERSSALPRFDYNDAFEIGNVARNLAKETFPNKPVVIDISLPNEHGLFRAVTYTGSSLDNDYWVERKRRTAMRFGCSSYFMGLKLREVKKSPEDKYFLDSKDYAFHGGAVPIFIDSCEFPVACLTISGLKQFEDHWLAVQAINEYLANSNEKDLALD
ncbi:hypothetical protein ZYGR_0H00710 [Zygosaccharomyces rouxii]|uniref:Uncharacterized protein n=1 Tax=Zygosaccharomyces rouxii TaxID=4956 RepID=A0A1Q2ZUQ2_ZYGRO|nr:hypothetical protein ZYGR_0H00710 [Zygosaccharomyces rouxii]